MVVISGVIIILAALCAVVGILTASDVISPFSEGLTWLFWFGLSGILFVASIALSMMRSE